MTERTSACLCRTNLSSPSLWVQLRCYSSSNLFFTPDPFLTILQWHTQRPDYLTAQTTDICFISNMHRVLVSLKPSGKHVSEAEATQQTDNLMMQMWTNLVKPDTQTPVLSHTHTQTHTCRVIVLCVANMKTRSFVSCSCSPQSANTTQTTVETSWHCHVPLRWGTVPHTHILYISWTKCTVCVNNTNCASPPPPPQSVSRPKDRPFLRTEGNSPSNSPSEVSPLLLPVSSDVQPHGGSGGGVVGYFLFNRGCALCVCSVHRNRDALWGLQPLGLHTLLR